MLKCKNCHANLSRLDKDICPFCGTKKPLEGQEDVTEDITKAFNPIKCEEKVVHKKKIVAFFLTVFLGVFGVHMFYLDKKKNGLITLSVSLSFIAVLGLILFFTCLKNVFAFLIPYFAVELLMIISAILILVRNDLVDGNGEFLE